jgi:hypothetical protein
VISLLVTGRIFALVTLILIWIFAVVSMSMAKKKLPTFRKLAGLDALPEMVGRAAETNKSVHFTTGGGGSLTDPVLPQLVAAMAVLGHVAELCAKYAVRVVYTVYLSEMMPIATEVMRSAYVKMGKEDAFNPEAQVRYMSGDQFAYASAVQGYAERERPAANIMIGPFYAESQLFAETFYRVGSISLAGTARGVQVPFFAVICDYMLIGEEIYAAGAYLSKDATQVGSIRGQDLGKLYALALIIIGVLMTAASSSFIVDLLRM